MAISSYLAFVAYACATTFLPGPNNVLLLTATGQFGFRKNLPLMCGIWTGLVTVMLLAGSFCSVLGTLVPQIAPIFKYVGAGYILYLAWKTVKRNPVSTDGSAPEEPLKYHNGFLLQFLNVKVIMLGLAAYPGYFLPFGHSFFLIVLFAVTMTICCGTGNLIWACTGSMICPVYNHYYKVVNWIMGLMLVYCAAKIVLM